MNASYYCFMCICIIISSVQSIDIRCSFETVSFNVVGASYTCKVQDAKISLPSIVTSVAGTHSHGKTNEQVKGFYLYSGICNYLPTKIDSFFANLEAIYIYQKQLKVITSDDLKPFSKLRLLYLSQNQIESLESRLFAFNPDLERVYFESNKIKSVGYNILTSLVKLKEAHFDNNVCINQYATSPSGLTSLKTSLNQKCFNIQFELTSLEDKLKSLMIENQNLTLEVSKLKESSVSNEISNELSTVKNELITTKNEWKNRQIENADKIKTLKEENSNLTLKMAKLENDLDETKSKCGGKFNELTVINDNISRKVSAFNKDLNTSYSELFLHQLKSEDKIKELENENKNLKSEVSMLKDALDSKSAEFEESHLRKFAEVLSSVTTMENEVNSKFYTKLEEISLNITNLNEDNQDFMETIDEKISLINQSLSNVNESFFEAIEENKLKLSNLLLNVNESVSYSELLIAKMSLESLSNSNDSFRTFSVISWAVVVILLITTWLTIFINNSKRKMFQDINMESMHSSES